MVGTQFENVSGGSPFKCVNHDLQNGKLKLQVVIHLDSYQLIISKFLEIRLRPRTVVSFPAPPLISPESTDELYIKTRSRPRPISARKFWICALSRVKSSLPTPVFTVALLMAPLRNTSSRRAPVSIFKLPTLPPMLTFA